MLLGARKENRQELSNNSLVSLSTKLPSYGPPPPVPFPVGDLLLLLLHHDPSPGQQELRAWVLAAVVCYSHCQVIVIVILPIPESTWSSGLEASYSSLGR